MLDLVLIKPQAVEHSHKQRRQILQLETTTPSLDFGMLIHPKLGQWMHSTICTRYNCIVNSTTVFFCCCQDKNMLTFVTDFFQTAML